MPHPKKPTVTGLSKPRFAEAFKARIEDRFNAIFGNRHHRKPEDADVWGTVGDDDRYKNVDLLLATMHIQASRWPWWKRFMWRRLFGPEVRDPLEAVAEDMMNGLVFQEYLNQFANPDPPPFSGPWSPAPDQPSNRVPAE